MAPTALFVLALGAFSTFFTPVTCRKNHPQKGHANKAFKDVPQRARVNNAQVPAATPSVVYAFYYPTPGAARTLITEISQVETTFVPQMTICPINGSVVALPTRSSVGAPYFNTTAGSIDIEATVPLPVALGTGVAKRDVMAISPAPTPAPSDCATVYNTALTTICATILSGFVTRVTVSKCHQSVTFSSEYGYSLEQHTTAMQKRDPVPSPYIRTATTFWYAPWQWMEKPEPPGDVDEKICINYDNGTRICELIDQYWTVLPKTSLTSTSTVIDLSTTVRGPARVMIETIHMDVTTNFTFISMTTTLDRFSKFITHSIHKSDKNTTIGRVTELPPALPASVSATPSAEIAPAPTETMSLVFVDT